MNRDKNHSRRKSRRTASSLPPKKQKGKSGQWVTNADALEKIADQYPIAELIISYVCEGENRR